LYQKNKEIGWCDQVFSMFLGENSPVNLSTAKELKTGSLARFFGTITMDSL